MHQTIEQLKAKVKYYEDKLTGLSYDGADEIELLKVKDKLEYYEDRVERYYSKKEHEDNFLRFGEKGGI